MISIVQSTVTRQIKDFAREAGFHAAGVVRYEKLEDAERRFLAWRDKGYSGEMSFINRYEERRDAFFAETSGWAKSIIVLGVNYYQEEKKGSSKKGSDPFWNKRGLTPFLMTPFLTLGKVARYAWGADYHKVIRARHGALIEKIKSGIAAQARFLSSIDTRPLFERELAQRAGLGFIGKQNQLLSLEFGPWLFLSEIITDLELEEDKPHRGDCGTCRLCIDACPTGAIVSPRELDASKCIAYLTVENPGEIPPDLAPKMKNWFFGCDDCLTICPYTAKSKETDWPEFRAGEGENPQWVNLDEILSIKSQGEFRRKFKDSAISRINKKQAVRNAKRVLSAGS